MKITFLSDNKTENSACTAEWGLSVFIESCGHKVLFDVGASPIFAENARNLGVDLKEAEAVVISHGHYDHTEGMEAFCGINGKAPIYIHKKAISEAYGIDQSGGIEDENCGIRWSEQFTESIMPRINFTEDVVKINDRMTIVGNTKPLEEYPMTDKFYRPAKNREDKFLEDPMDHEQFLVVKEPKGLYVFSGCSHVGMMAVINRVSEMFPDEKIVALIAGMHLYPLSKEEKRKVVDSICNLGIEKIFPVHCTGMEAILMFKERLGDGCVIASAGETYEC